MFSHRLKAIYPFKASKVPLFIWPFSPPSPSLPAAVQFKPRPSLRRQDRSRGEAEGASAGQGLRRLHRLQSRLLWQRRDLHDPCCHGHDPQHEHRNQDGRPLPVSLSLGRGAEEKPRRDITGRPDVHPGLQRRGGQTRRKGRQGGEKGPSARVSGGGSGRVVRQEVGGR